MYWKTMSRKRDNCLWENISPQRVIYSFLHTVICQTGLRKWCSPSEKSYAWEFAVFCFLLGARVVLTHTPHIPHPIRKCQNDMFYFSFHRMGTTFRHQSRLMWAQPSFRLRKARTSSTARCRILWWSSSKSTTPSTTLTTASPWSTLTTKMPSSLSALLPTPSPSTSSLFLATTFLQAEMTWESRAEMIETKVRLCKKKKSEIYGSFSKAPSQFDICHQNTNDTNKSCHFWK